MMKRILRNYALAALAILAGGMAQAQDCELLMRSFAVSQPEPGAVSKKLTRSAFDCSGDQIAMFERNYNAITKAQPVTGADDLFGTWLGDDVLLYLMGVVVLGQEVLTISPGEEPGSIRVRQYWIKSTTPDQQAFPWDIEDGYKGDLAEAMLNPQQVAGEYRTDRLGGGASYSGRSFFEIERMIFDCFTHQQRLGRGPLIKAMAPHSPDDIRENLAPMVVLQNELEALHTSFAANGLPDDAQQEAMQALFDRSIAAQEDPEYRKVFGALMQGGELGCPRLN